MSRLINIPRYLSVGKEYDLGEGKIEFALQDYKKLLHNLKIKQKMNNNKLIIQGTGSETVIGYVKEIHKSYITIEYIDNSYISYNHLNESVTNGTAVAIEKLMFKDEIPRNSFKCVTLHKYILSLLIRQYPQEDNNEDI